MVDLLLGMPLIVDIRVLVVPRLCNLRNSLRNGFSMLGIILFPAKGKK